MERGQLKHILESLLFSSELPIKLEKFHDIFSEVSLHELRDLIVELQSEYERLDRSFVIREVAHGYQMCTKPEYSPWIKKFKKIRPLRLSPATMETLVIIAYKQPITRAEIEEIRGVDIGGILRTLLEKNLIKVTGKKDVPGKPLLYGTTPKFLTIFGLKSLKDLPTLEDIKQFDENTLPLSPQKLQEESEESPDDKEIVSDDVRESQD